MKVDDKKIEIKEEMRIKNRNNLKIEDDESESEDEQ